MDNNDSVVSVPLLQQMKRDGRKIVAMVVWDTQRARIADRAGVRTPTFFGYVFNYSLPILFPILAFGGWLFL